MSNSVASEPKSLTMQRAYFQSALSIKETPTTPQCGKPLSAVEKQKDNCLFLSYGSKYIHTSRNSKRLGEKKKSNRRTQILGWFSRNIQQRKASSIPLYIPLRVRVCEKWSWWQRMYLDSPAACPCIVTKTFQWKHVEVLLKVGSEPFTRWEARGAGGVCTAA